MKHKNNDISNWRVFLSCVFLLSFVAKDVSGQVTYRATEDALKQLVKDIEALRHQRGRLDRQIGIRGLL